MSADWAQWAGKTTLLKVINGLIKPDASRIRIRGKSAPHCFGCGIQSYPDRQENIYVSGSILGLSKAEIVSSGRNHHFANSRVHDAPVQSYSPDGVRLGFAVAVKCQPNVSPPNALQWEMSASRPNAQCPGEFRKRHRLSRLA
jgi:lipopolysaccharide transport system ATP-binding protein